MDKITVEIPVDEARKIVSKYPGSCYVAPALAKWEKENDPTIALLEKGRPGQVFRGFRDGQNPTIGAAAAGESDSFVKLSNGEFLHIGNVSGNSFGTCSLKKTAEWFKGYTLWVI